MGRSIKNVRPPEEAGKIVSVTEFRGSLFIACEKRVYRVVDWNLVPLLFVRTPDET